MDLKSRIISTLSNGALTAKEIASRLNVEKSEVNRILYHDRVFTQNNTSPPTWSTVPVQTKKVERIIDTIILLDLGNVHDCLKNLEPYVRTGDMVVFAFCDYGYSGYPLSEKQYNVDGVKIVRATSPKKNAADTLLIWTCCSIVNRETGGLFHLQGNDVLPNLADRLEFIVVTKDQGFNFLQECVENTGHKIRFCKDWDDLKLYI